MASPLHFLSPWDYTAFFQVIKDGHYAGWRSGLMQELMRA